jgi:phage terminase small subunit
VQVSDLSCSGLRADLEV